MKKKRKHITTKQAKAARKRLNTHMRKPIKKSHLTPRMLAAARIRATTPGISKERACVLAGYTPSTARAKAPEIFRRISDSEFTEVLHQQGITPESVAKMFAKHFKGKNKWISANMIRLWCELMGMLKKDDISIAVRLMVEVVEKTIIEFVPETKRDECISRLKQGMRELRGSSGSIEAKRLQA